jgi:LmbE family N-acetylglucosaminyl deacetylase
MHTHYHAIYLSPHLDDAALSCGGQIFQRAAAGERILIVTITAGDPPRAALSDYAQSLQNRWELLTNATAARRAEDMAACAILGADWLHWQVPDCIYRLHPESGQPFYVSDPDIFGDVAPAERGLVALLAQQIRALPAHDRLYAPLTIGHHVDHLWTRAAAELAAELAAESAAERVGGEHLFYYEDYPYAQQPGALEQVIAAGASQWRATAIALDAAARKTKIDAILAFRSQLSTFWTDLADLERQVNGYADQVGGERNWQTGKFHEAPL